jgi:uncharacterized membrane protein
MKTVLKTIGLVIGVIALVALVTYLQVWVLHWAVGLFTPISMMQSFAIIIIFNILGSVFRGISVKNNR